MAMNNNPTSSVDPDGGCEGGNCPPQQGDIKDNQIYDGNEWLPVSKEVTVNFVSEMTFFRSENTYRVDKQRHLNYLFNRPMIKQYEPTIFDYWSETEFVPLSMAYNSLDAMYSTVHFFTPWSPDRHLNGRPVDSQEKVKAFATTAAMILPATSAIPKLNVAQFSTLGRGTILLAPTVRGTAHAVVNAAVTRAVGLSGAAAEFAKNHDRFK